MCNAYSGLVRAQSSEHFRREALSELDLHPVCARGRIPIDWFERPVAPKVNRVILSITSASPLSLSRAGFMELAALGVPRPPAILIPPCSAVGELRQVWWLGRRGGRQRQEAGEEGKEL